MELTQEQKGKIGETAVMLELLKKGFNVININNSYPNYKNADLICMNANNGKSVMIQVKTGTTQNILTGFTSDVKGSIPKLEEKIIGPWVFVYMPDDKMSNMEFYILTREEVIELISSSNKWYATEYYRELKKKYPVGVYVDWLEGGLSKATKLHPEYKSTLRQTSKGNWWKITKLLD
ncbi:MAG: hypothetical protein IKV46_05615 [Bacteroidales bacterium]|nr:hypothetical protein [Bacteroidales bacterium]